MSLHCEVLLASHKLELAGHRQFSAERLAVACYENDRTKFGLRDYELTYPDVTKVYVSLMGYRGLVARRLLEKVGPKKYALSSAGRDVAKRILSGATSWSSDPVVLAASESRLGRKRRRQLGVAVDAHKPVSSVSATPSRVVIGREDATLLTRLLDDPVVHLWGEKAIATCTFVAACRFWGVADADTLHISRRIDTLVGKLSNLAVFLTNAETVLPSGRLVTALDVGNLLTVCGDLQKMYSRNIRLINNRLERAS